MSSVDSLTARLLAERHFPTFESNEWAVMCLEAGFDSKHLRMLAATIPNDGPSVSGEIERKALSELGWDKLSSYEYLLEYARSLASDILDGRIGTIDGSRRMYRLMYEANLQDELSGWYEVDEMIFSREHYQRTGNKDYYYCEPAEFDRIVEEHCKHFLVTSRAKTAPLPETGFDEAESIFREFLSNNEQTGDIIWVFAEELIIGQSDLDCYLPNPEENRDLAQRLYEAAVKRRFGVGLNAFAKLNDNLLAFIRAPTDELDSQYKLMSEHFVKFSLRSHLRYQVHEITSPLIWTIKNLFTNDQKRVGYEDEIPFRKSVSG